MSIGFCGALSTVSTFMKEIRLLDRMPKRGLLKGTTYAAATIVTAQVIAGAMYSIFFATTAQYP